MTSSPLHRVIRTARRRLVIAALARQSIWRLLIILAIALMTCALQRHFSRPLLPTILVITVTVTILDAFRSIRLPTLHMAALELDRQFQLHELLSTAIACETSTDGVARSVAAQAQGAAANLDVNRLRTPPHPITASILCLIFIGLFPLVYAPATASSASHTVHSQTADTLPQSPPSRFHPLIINPPVLTCDSVPSGSSTDAARLCFPDTSNATSTSHLGNRSTESQSAGQSSGPGFAQGVSTSNPNPLPTLPSPSQDGLSPASGGTSFANPSAAEAFIHNIATVAQPETAPAHHRSSSAARTPRNTANSTAPLVPDGYRDIVQSYFAR